MQRYPQRDTSRPPDGGKWGSRVKARRGCDGAANHCAVFIFLAPMIACAFWQREPGAELVASIHYNRSKVYIRSVLTRLEYDR